jgi:hypothetical protein
MRSRAKYVYFRHGTRNSDGNLAMKGATDSADGQKELCRATVVIEVDHIH